MSKASELGWYLQKKARFTDQVDVSGDWGFIEMSTSGDAMALKQHIPFNGRAPKGHMPVVFPVGTNYGREHKFIYGGNIQYTGALHQPQQVEEFLYRFSQCLIEQK